MSQYPINSGYHWQFPTKENNHINFPGPIHNIPEKSVSEHIAELSGTKVEALETLETTVQVELNKRHIYLTQVGGNYSLEVQPPLCPLHCPPCCICP